MNMNGSREEDTSEAQDIRAQLVARNAGLTSWPLGRQSPLSSWFAVHERQRLQLAQQVEYYVELFVGLSRWKRPVHSLVDPAISMCLGRSG